MCSEWTKHGFGVFWEEGSLTAQVSERKSYCTGIWLTLLFNNCSFLITLQGLVLFVYLIVLLSHVVSCVYRVVWGHCVLWG